MWTHVERWAGILALIATALAWMSGAFGFQNRSTGDRLATLEATAFELRQFKEEQSRINKSVQIWMCATNYPSAVMAQIPCSAFGIYQDDRHLR